MSNELEETGALLANLNAVLASSAKSASAGRWYEELEAFLADIKCTDTSKLKDRTFLRRLWDDNPVSAVGNGTVKMTPALENDEFVEWFAERASSPLPLDPLEAETVITSLYKEAAQRLGKLCGRTPRLKLNRVLCALFPDYFTTIADVGKLLYLHRAMGGLQSDHAVRAHVAVRRRIDEVLGDLADGDERARVVRMCLPWMLYKRLADDEATDVEADTEVKPNALAPLPATLRRKGLTAMKGSFQTLLGFLPALNDGVTREEFRDLIRQANPELGEPSVGSAINVVMREFDLCKREGDIYRLSARGINLLESQDPDEFADHLLARVLGVDHVVCALAHEARAKADLMSLLQRVNPGWTTEFAPSALLGWLVSLGVIEVTSGRRYALTDLGRRWREMVSWEPQFLPKPAETVVELAAEVIDKVQLPAWQELSSNLAEAVAGRLLFDDNLVMQLHAGLWFHPVRHFAVLTGISGAGKTQLALNYALALCGEQVPGQETVKVIPVQPGWFDSGPLLGYVSPIRESAYCSAPFLELLARAADNPGRPYVAILDEMNLSHPEQYMAPVLSAMETQGTIDLHQLAEGTTQIPRSIRYPANMAIIGTVNMDETTHGLSDKVLDRAFTLEFWNIDVSDFPRWENSALSISLRDKAKRVLQSFGEVFAPLRLHFGWRTIDDVLSYLVFATHIGANETQALDDALYAKVLPKLRGEHSEQFERALQASAQLFREHGLRRCLDKTGSMQRDLERTGAARFWR